VHINGKRYFVDGYYKDPITNQETVLEYLGCYWHGCPKCYSKNDAEDEVFEETRKNNNSMECDPRTKHSFYQRYKLYQKRHQDLEAAGYRVIEIWEHEFSQQKRDNPELIQFCSTRTITPHLDPREAFFGGRTNATTLYYKVQDNETIQYQDVTSLYPTVLKYDVFPVGHPKVITKDFNHRLFWSG